MIAALLTWQYVAETRERSKQLEITLLRLKLKDFLHESPSLTAVMSDVIDHAYEIATL